MGNRKNIWVEVGSILFFAFGVFLISSILSFQGQDPSWMHYVSQNISGHTSGQVHNACGRIGAWISSIVLELFGLGAFLLPAAFFFVGIVLHKQEKRGDAWVTLAGMSVAISSLTVFVAVHWQNWKFGGVSLLTGGVFGSWIADALIRQLNTLGSSLVTLCIFILAWVISTPLSVAIGIGRLARISADLTSRFMKWGMTSLGVLFSFAMVWIGVRLSQFGTTVGMRLAQRWKQRKAVPPQPTSAPAEVEWMPEDIDLAPESPKPVLLEPVVKAEPLPVEKPVQSEITILPRESDPTSIAKPVRPLSKVRKGAWKLPTVEFLKNPPQVHSSVDKEKLIQNSQILKQKFSDFGIEGEVTAVRPGPVITLYEFKPGPGVKVSRIASLADDLSMALSAQSVRILAPLPGKSVVGIEIPSDIREMVYLREFLQHPDFYGTKHSIPVVMGKEIGGQTYLSDLARMPHLLCAGQTGSGKSVFMNGLICSLFYRFSPDELRMILVDPKFIEFRAYQDIPHLLLPVVDDPKHASIALKWAVREMERRYRILAKIGARNLASFNQKVEEMGADVISDLLFSEENSSESQPTAVSGGDWIEAFEADESGAPRVSKLPYIVVIIDELADLMMIAKKEVEISIARIAQKARAAGIHLVIATQRPSTDVITGLIKANLPSRVSFQLASYVDSKTILDRAGAERLLGQGDMLFIPPGVSQTLRLHGAYLDDDEIHKITTYLKSQGKPSYRDEILLVEDEDEMGGSDENDKDENDELFQEAVELVKRSGHASASFLQRHFKVGYNRAARMIETMESRGIVGPQDGARPREVLMR